ncbi:hypothetical protein I3842_Q133700 [Carya illinoinensis]|uniref:Uncharacterized protein n=1 Tax=Carya illinoinensis TaxID=32201 RepID=A0A921ZXK5_CARIL|nr:hypothetical protein I3842_Q133700 [Carya illinoinensis]
MLLEVLEVKKRHAEDVAAYMWILVGALKEAWGKVDGKDF